MNNGPLRYARYWIYNRKLNTSDTCSESADTPDSETLQTCLRSQLRINKISGCFQRQNPFLPWKNEDYSGNTIAFHFQPVTSCH